MNQVERLEVLRELDRVVSEKGTQLLPIDKCWQPSDYLPDLSREDWYDETLKLRAGAAQLSDSVLVSLVANMITEEALPSYHKWLDSLDGGFDASGVSDSGLAKWTRGWVAEEKRHGDVLQKYLYLSGRVNFKAVDITLQHLLSEGFDPHTENDVYLGFVYTSFQERATFIAHSGIARLARQHGDQLLGKLCDRIAGDEIRHGRSYEKFMSVIFELDPDGAMLAFAKMMKRKIVMPGRNISDGKTEQLFQLFSDITEQNGSYTSLDYAETVDHLTRVWQIGDVAVTTDAAKSAQEYVLGLPARYYKLAERSQFRRPSPKGRAISWIFDRSVNAE